MFKYYVHFSTIQPRFQYLSDVINSWLRQNIKPEKIIITTSTLDSRYISTEILDNYKNDNIIIQTIDIDYGPNNKILGALKFYETLEDKENVCIVICDDDIIYNINTIKSYKDYMDKYKNDFILTHFYSPYCRFVNKTYGLEHLQGADTYLLSNKFLSSTTYSDYDKYLKDTIDVCPDAFYQDDYVISYYIHFISKLKVKYIQSYSSYKNNNNIPKETQMHKDVKVHERESNTVNYFNNLIKLL